MTDKNKSGWETIRQHAKEIRTKARQKDMLKKIMTRPIKYKKKLPMLNHIPLIGSKRSTLFNDIDDVRWNCDTCKYRNGKSHEF